MRSRWSYTILAMLVVLIAFPAFAKKEKPKEEKPESISKCAKLPIYGELRDCMSCHVPPSMRLKEEDPHAWRDYPVRNMWVYSDAQGEYGYYAFIDDVSHNYSGVYFYQFFRYLEKHNINRAIIEVQSFGGSVFEAWRIVGILAEAISKGFKVTTKVQSIAASAGAIIFLAGEERLISPTAELMFHELWTFKFLAIESPADKEDEARVLRHIQDTITEWVASRSNLTKKEIDELTRKKEFWVRGTQAMEYGFATGFISK